MLPVFAPFLVVLSEEIIAAGIVGAACGALGGIIGASEE